MPKNKIMDQDYKAGRKPGRFDLKYLDGWAVLTVFPPDESSGVVYPEDVTARMEILGIPRVRQRIISEIIEEAAGQPRKLVEWPNGADLTGSVEISVSDDEMTGWIEITPPKKGGSDPDIEDIYAALKEKGIIYGIKEESIQNALENHQYRKKITAAEGLPVIHGEAPKVKYLFETNRGKPYLEMDFGRINLRELNFVQNVKEDDTLALIGGPTEPRNGKTVYGTVLPAEPPGEADSFQTGDNTRFNEEGNTILSNINGNVFLQHGKVHVEPVVHVKNVDYSTGNIDFEGTVVIDGSIADGFTVKAWGNIQVGKYAGKCSLEAGNNIILKAGMHGSGEGRIECGGDLYAKYFETAEVTSRGSIFVEEAVMDCEVYASGNIVLKGKRAEIIGGHIVAGGVLWCKELGNANETKTQAVIGIPPDDYRDFVDAGMHLKESHELLSDVDEKIQQIQRHLQLSEQQEEKYLQALTQLMNQSEELEERIKGLKEFLKQAPLKSDKNSFLVVEETMHYGVTVRFGKKEFQPPHKGAHKTILKSGIQNIQESGYNRQDPPKIPVFNPDEETHSGA